MIINLPINHIDDRGSIRDIFVGTPKDHCSIITFTLGAIRANHFHKLTTQYTYVIEGEITMATSMVVGDSQLQRASAPRLVFSNTPAQATAPGWPSKDILLGRSNHTVMLYPLAVLDMRAATMLGGT